MLTRLEFDFLRPGYLRLRPLVWWYIIDNYGVLGGIGGKGGDLGVKYV